MKINNPVINKDELIDLFNEKFCLDREISNYFRMEFCEFFGDRKTVSSQQVIRENYNISILHKMRNFIINYK